MRHLHKMTGRSFFPIAVILSLVLLTGVPVHAGPVVVSEVIQVLSGYQNPADLQLRSIQTTGVRLGGIERAGVRQSAANTSVQGPDVVTATSLGDSLLSGVVIDTSGPQGRVEVIAQGEIEGTICDCGDIWVFGGFPKWPLLFLAGIPFFFTDDDIPPTTPIPTPFPTPPPPPVSTPEPGSLLLLGTGMAVFGAGLRRRYAKTKLARQIHDTEEGQST